MRHLPSSLLAPLLAAALAACGGSPDPADDAEAQEPCAGLGCDEARRVAALSETTCVE